MAHKDYLNTITSYLEKLKIKFGLTTISEQQVIGCPWIVDEKDYLILIKRIKKHIIISSALILSKDILEEKRETVLCECMRANHEILDAFYDCDQQHNIGCSRTFQISILESTSGLDFFKHELDSVVFGIKHFVNNIAPKYNLEINGFGNVVENFINQI